MKLLVLCIFIAGLAATQAKKCDLKKPECVEIFTENETEGPEGPKPKPCDCRKCQADAIALATQAKKCDLKKPECVEIFTENEPEGPEGPKPKPCDCRKCQADAIALSL